MSCNKLVGVPSILFMGFLIILVLVHSAGVREDGQHAIMAAIARMDKVVISGDMNDLLSACRSGDGEVQCRQADYGVTYRGHRILASQIAVDYHRTLHDKWDAGSQGYLPYMTAIVDVERTPRLHSYGGVVN